MPGTIDLLLAGLIAIVYPIWDTFYLSPRMHRMVADDPLRGRPRFYGTTIGLLWVGTAAIAAAWIGAARPWGPLGLVVPMGWRLAVTGVLVGAVLLLHRAQMATVRRLDAAKRARVRARETSASILVPRNPTERAWFVLTSLSAGFCEEFIYRGFLVWAFRPWLGLWGAALASLLVFSLGHLYLGRKGVMRAGTFGAGLALLTIATGSVVPAMILHALLDLISGEVSYAIFADEAEVAVTS